jgi:asparagine synthase (glutamine-hydrolysing)
MCGIYGFVGNGIYDCYKLFMKIKHRGPDQSIFIDNNTYKIGFHRLSIHDLSINGMQPFTYSTDIETIYILCNGEIYNYEELKKEVYTYDNNIWNYGKYEFKSYSDCEVLLPLFLKYGINFAHKLDGEYAIAIFHIINGQQYLYLIRDRFGVRPLYYTVFNNNFSFSSEMKSLTYGENNIYHVEPSTIMKIEFSDLSNLKVLKKKYYDISNVKIMDNVYNINFNDIINNRDIINTSDFELLFKPEIIKNLNTIQQNIRSILTESVKLRLSSDVEIGCLLSGGLDSSLIASIASRLLRAQGKTLKTFCIGMKNSPDVKYALNVAEFIGSHHTTIEIPEEEFLKAYEEIVNITETYDITTNRATTAQYLISKWISENTNIKVILVGDLSDEICSGYLYFHKTPNPYESHLENIKLLKDNHCFDLLRTDRGIAWNGLEARVPFASHKFVNYYLSIYPELRMAKNNIEKWLLRISFEGYLPNDVLYRKKEAFSDGISSNENSWFNILQRNIEHKISDEDFERLKINYNPEIKSKEALNLRLIFDEIFVGQEHILPYYWMPNWIECNGNPSARILDVYHEN